MSGAARLVLASGNAGKLRELKRLLEPLRLDVVAQQALGIAGAEETAVTFVENALLKARHAAACSGLPAIADDSGLSVDALDGAPGVYSARYAGAGCSDEDNVTKLLEALRDVADAKRTARFECTIVYLRNATDPAPLIAQAAWHGHILREPRGANGFGYDPVFSVAEFDGAVAEQPPEAKNAVSHRAKAMARLLELLRPG